MFCRLLSGRCVWLIETILPARRKGSHQEYWGMPPASGQGERAGHYRRFGHTIAALPSILKLVAPITWMVMSRDVSDFVRVADQPIVIAVLILDVDTGLIRGLSAAEDIRRALSESVERALTRPAGSLPPGYPERILAAVGLGDLVAGELGRQPGLNLIPPVDEIVPGAEAEEIFDEFVDAIAGIRQPTDPFNGSES